MRSKFIYINATIVLMVVSASVAVIGTTEYLEANQEADGETVQTTDEGDETVVQTMTNVTIEGSDSIETSISLLYDAVFLIDTQYRNQTIGTGTGFVYKKEDGLAYILTNHHVIADGNKIYVVSTDGTTTEAELIGSDEYSDIAVLTIPEEAAPLVAIMGSSEETSLGDTLFTVGSPLGEEYIGTVTKGILSGKDRLIEIEIDNGTALMGVIQTDAAINPGNSGGPLANIKGEVIGINSLKLVQEEVEGMGFAIPIEDALQIASKLEAGDGLNRPLFGIELIDADNTYQINMYGIELDKEYTNGIIVINTSEGYPAANAGLEKGDVITKVDGKLVTNSDHFKYLLYKYDINEKMVVTYERDGVEYVVTATLDKISE